MGKSNLGANASKQNESGGLPKSKHTETNERNVPHGQHPSAGKTKGPKVVPEEKRVSGDPHDMNIAPRADRRLRGVRKLHGFKRS